MATVPTKNTPSNTFPFNVANDGTVTSAGAYDKITGLKLRDLWANKVKNAGLHTSRWDGKDDNGNQMPLADYDIKISSNKNTYTWLGTLGNNSLNPSGQDIWRGVEMIADMVQVGNFMNCVMPFSEASSAGCKFNINSPRQKIEYQAWETTYAAGLFICANATYKFIASKDYSGTNNFIHAELVSNDTDAHLTAGIAFSTSSGPHISYPSVIGLNALGNAGLISGLAVQQSGNGYLYAAYRGQNYIDVFKTGDGSGSVVRRINIAGATNIEFETDGFLWVSQGTTITKYTVNADGSLTATAQQLTGFSRVAGLSILNGDICVLDAGNQQVIKRYNSTSLVLIGIVGQVGGYSASPVIAPDKFYIEDLSGPYLAAVRHQANGSFWVIDTGNCRFQHFAADGTFIESVMYMTRPYTYNINVCINQNTSVFAGPLEYNIDYSLPFGSSWSLVNNWGYNIPAGFRNTNAVSGIILMPNAKRYCILADKSDNIPPYAANNEYEAELTNSGLRVIPAKLPLFSVYNPSGDGSITDFIVTGATGSATLTYRIYALTGFTGNNPVRSAAVSLGTIQSGFQGPLPQDRSYNVTTDGKVIVFDNIKNSVRGSSQPIYHLAAYDAVTMTEQWKAARSTVAPYNGDMPRDGAFDTQNAVNYPASPVTVVNNEIVYGYHGENWKGLQTGLFFHHNSIGLLQGIAGFVGPEISAFNGSQSAAGYPGYFTNALKTNAVSVNGKIYCFFGDESINAGISVWEIDLINVNIEVVNLTLTSRVFDPPVTRFDLLSGYPVGWTENPPLYNNSNADHFKVVVGSLNHKPGAVPSIAVSAAWNSTAHKSFTETRVLNAKSNCAFWKVDGLLDISHLGFGLKAGGLSCFISVLDKAGKVLAKLETFNDKTVSFNGVNHGPFTNYGNPKAQYGISEFSIEKLNGQVRLLIYLFGQWLSATENISDNTGDVTDPGYFVINFNYTGNTNQSVQYGLTGLHFQNS